MLYEDWAERERQKRQKRVCREDTGIRAPTFLDDWVLLRRLVGFPRVVRRLVQLLLEAHLAAVDRRFGGGSEFGIWLGGHGDKVDGREVSDVGESGGCARVPVVVVGKAELGRYGASGYGWEGFREVGGTVETVFGPGLQK